MQEGGSDQSASTTFLTPPCNPATRALSDSLSQLRERSDCLRERALARYAEQLDRDNRREVARRLAGIVALGVISAAGGGLIVKGAIEIFRAISQERDGSSSFQQDEPVYASTPTPTTEPTPTATPTQTPSPEPTLTPTPERNYRSPYPGIGEISEIYNIARDARETGDQSSPAQYVELDDRSVQRYLENGFQAVEVIRARGFYNPDNNTFYIDPENPEDLEEIDVFLVGFERPYPCQSASGGDTCILREAMLVEVPIEGDRVTASGTGNNVSVSLDLNHEGQIAQAWSAHY